MRTRRAFQPTLDSMPNRIVPSSGMLKSAVAPVIAHSSGMLKSAVAPVIAHSSGIIEAAVTRIGHGVQPMDTTDPTNTATGDGATQTIIQPVTPPTTLIC